MHVCSDKLHSILRECSVTILIVTHRSLVVVYVRTYVCADAVPVPKKSEPGPGEMRAKLFYKKGEEYVTLGVGMLSVTKKGESAWLLMRSDTVTKKTLLSVLVTSKTPLQVTQKSLLFVSPPNPPLDLSKKDPDSPVSYVLRVKTVEEAERLHSSIKEAFS